MNSPVEIIFQGLEKVVGVIRIGSNIAALQAQRRLDRATKDLSQTFERLATGLRINRASDDAAGLAIASSLSASGRILGQGIRNINDSASLLNVAEGALGELQNVTTRLSELAEQAANGTLTSTQRRALDREALQLTKEFNRITRTTTFNGRNLLDGLFGKLNVETGSSSNVDLSFGLGAGISQTVGTGRFIPSSAGQFDSSLGGELVTGDINGDGKVDLVELSNLGVRIHRGNGDGTFVSSAGGFAANGGALSDINGDGRADLVYGNASGGFSVRFGTVGGTFSAATNYTVGAGNFADVELADINNDGLLDFIGSKSGLLVTALGTGNGTFGSPVQNATISTLMNLAVGDTDNDGTIEVFGTYSGTSIVRLKLDSNGVAFGNSSIGSYVEGIQDLHLGDMNDDGLLDLVVGTTAQAVVRLNQGNGTYTVSAAKSLPSAQTRMHLVDIDGDGYLDVVGGIGYYYRGNGDGTLGDRIKSDLGLTIIGDFAAADFDGDGDIDTIAGDLVTGQLQLNLADGVQSTVLKRKSLMNQADAKDALLFYKGVLTKISTELGSIGAAQSRLSTASSNLQNLRENYDAARSAIEDADLASESAQLVRGRIIQQAAAAILSQANQLPALALQLLQRR